jgi:YD repeat-containing protein
LIVVPASGDLFRLAYPDGTAAVTYTNWNRVGQPRELYDASGKHELTYDYASRLVSDYCPSGLVAGVTVAHHFDPQYGRDYLEVSGSGFTLHHDFGYDPYVRLNMVSNGAQAALYGYLPNSDRLQTTAFHSSGSPVMTTTRAWEWGERLSSIHNPVGTPSTASVTSHSYLYDALHRRTQATLEDGSSWQYEYNDRNELTGGKRSWQDWTPVAGQQFEYAFDNIGNRTSSKAGGDANSANLRTTTYAANALNQYTTVTTPGYKDVLGAALATNSVTVNSGSCSRKGEYFNTSTAKSPWPTAAPPCGRA